ncbi:hypothetical protein DFH11DRAFT_1604981 [Phellopilus nigrolimitatus]|nr:hypothetical protein DFH11DRAFT_1604981 [Phellopilus nigrolimitatus]
MCSLGYRVHLISLTAVSSTLLSANYLEFPTGIGTCCGYIIQCSIHLPFVEVVRSVFRTCKGLRTYSMSLTL